MAIKNTLLGGTDLGNEELTSTDFNDTFNAAVSKIQSLSAFWLNTDLYDVYDDFESYSVGNFTDNTKWEVTLTTEAPGGEGTATIAASTNAGGTGQELVLTATTSGNEDLGSAEVYTKSLGANKHTYAKFKNTWGTTRYSTSQSMVISFGNATDGWTTVTSTTPGTGGAVTDRVNTLNVPANIVLVIAKGSNVYDVYIGGKKLIADSTKANGAQLKFFVSYEKYSQDASSYLYIDDVRQSKSTITA